MTTLFTVLSPLFAWASNIFLPQLYRLFIKTFFRSFCSPTAWLSSKSMPPDQEVPGSKPNSAVEFFLVEHCSMVCKDWVFLHFSVLCPCYSLYCCLRRRATGRGGPPILSIFLMRSIETSKSWRHDKWCKGKLKRSIRICKWAILMIMIMSLCWIVQLKCIHLGKNVMWVLFYGPLFGAETFSDYLHFHDKN